MWTSTCPWDRWPCVGRTSPMRWPQSSSPFPAAGGGHRGGRRMRKEEKGSNGADWKRGEGLREGLQRAELGLVGQSPAEPLAVAFVPAWCHIWLCSLCFSFQKVYLWAGMGLPSASTSVARLSLRNLQPWPLSVSRRCMCKGQCMRKQKGRDPLPASSTGI